MELTRSESDSGLSISLSESTVGVERDLAVIGAAMLVVSAVVIATVVGSRFKGMVESVIANCCSVDNVSKKNHVLYHVG